MSMLRPLSVVLALAAVLATGPAQAAARDYRIDPVHSRVLFSVRHLGFSDALGTLSAPRGWLRFDAEDWRSAQATVELELASLDLGDPEWNRRLARRDGFDSAAHPLARFVSERVEPLDRQRFRLHGRLRLRGVERPLTLEVRFNRLARHPLTLRRTAGFSATATLSRAEFGLDAWQSMVGDRVELRIEVEAQRARRRHDSPAATEDATP